MLYPMLAGLLLNRDVPLREQPHRLQTIEAVLGYPTSDDELREIVRTGKPKQSANPKLDVLPEGDIPKRYVYHENNPAIKLRRTFVNVLNNAEHPLDATALLREVAWEIERDYNEPANEGLRYTPFFVLHVVIDLYDGIASIYLKDNRHEDEQ